MPLAERLYRIGCGLLDLIYPPKCVFCAALIPASQREEGICLSCQNTLPRTAPGILRQLDDSLSPVYAPLWYRNRVRESVLRYKFGGRSHYHRVYGPLLRHCLLDADVAPPDYVTWAPLSRQRLRKRGYDQAYLLAQEAGKLYGQRPIPLLKKIRHTKAQSSLTAAQRRRNPRNAYEYAGGFPLSGARVLLVDDVVTTGATLDACAMALYRAGCAEVVCLALSSSVGGDARRTSPTQGHRMT